jgi:hypothetical protein
MKIKNLILIIFFGLVFQGFMFFTKSKSPRWSGGFPYINFKTNASGFSASAEDVTDILKRTSDKWFQSGKGKIRLFWNGTSTNNSPTSPSSFNCETANQEDLFKKDKVVFASAAEDPDCTAESCSFIWICEEDILHFDTQVNTRDYYWTTSAEITKEDNDLETNLLHELGHVLGLSHCKLGKTEDDCKSNIGEGHSIPGVTSVMYQFENTGVIKRDLTNDDILGIRSLYGELKTSLPVSGKYALNEKDIWAISIATRSDEEKQVNTPHARQIQAASIKELQDFVNTGEIDRTLDWAPVTGYSQGMKITEFMNLSFQYIQDGMSARTDEELEIMRNTSTISVVTMEDLMDKYTPSPDVPDRSFLELITNKNNELRNAIIDEQEKRQ